MDSIKLTVSKEKSKEYLKLPKLISLFFLIYEAISIFIVVVDINIVPRAFGYLVFTAFIILFPGIIILSSCLLYSYGVVQARKLRIFENKLEIYYTGNSGGSTCGQGGAERYSITLKKVNSYIVSKRIIKVRGSIRKVTTGTHLFVPKRFSRKNKMMRIPRIFEEENKILEYLDSNKE